jgi:hypothetical protein
MKKIFSSPIVGEIPRLRGMLESAGITCLLRNEISAGLSPELPLSESTPELWIQDDLRLSEALQIKADFKSSATVVGKDWQCEKCGETSEPQFNSCWKCGALRAEQIPVICLEREQAAPVPDKEAVVVDEAVVQEVESGTPCVRCEKHIAVGEKFCPFCGWTQP